MKKINLIIFFIFTLLISFTFLSLEKSNGQTNLSSSSSSGECIVCTQVVPNCSSNEILIPQTCNECAHCVTTSSDSNNNCKCSSGQYYVLGFCSNDIHGDCFPNYKPVCGCDSKTYGNSCVASFSGIKSTKNGACSSSGSESIECLFDGDCPPGICSSSGTFKNYSCLKRQCNQIFYFADPCQFQSSSSGDLITLNKNFSGTWKARIPKSQGSSSGIACNLGCKTFCPDGKPDPSRCVCICEPVNPEKCICQNGKVICNGCEPSCPPLYFDLTCDQFTEKESFNNGEQKPVCCTLAGGGRYCPDRASCVIPLNTRVDSKIITLNLCVKDQNLNGTINIPGDIEDGIIASQRIISKNTINVTVNDKSNLSKKVTLQLKNKRYLFVATPNNAFEVTRISFSRKCPSSSTSNSSSSSGGSDCTPKGNCRGENGEELSCPSGTECSGLPAYGCYPPGCPVPICCSPDTRIRTDGVQKRIADIKKGELVISDDGKAVKVKKVSKTPVKNHKILKITLNDATILEISPGHPTADGRKFKDLKMGDILDGRMVIETKLIPYIQSHTYDILPDSKSGNYYANGVLIGSTLK